MIDDISLRIIESDEDIAFLFEMFTASDQHLFSSTIPLNSISEFTEWISSRLRNYYHDFRIMHYNNSPVGFIYSFDHFASDGHCKICVDVLPSFRNSGIGGLGTILFADYLFKTYPLRKIYSTVYDYNKQSLMTNIKSGLVEEGKLNGIKYYNGKFYDLHFFSISRDLFYSTLYKYILFD